MALDLEEIGERLARGDTHAKDVRALIAEVERLRQRLLDAEQQASNAITWQTAMIRAEDDLRVNARLLARQCDLAREAETERDQLRERLAEQERHTTSAREEIAWLRNQQADLEQQASNATTWQAGMVRAENEAKRLRAALVEDNEAATARIVVAEAERDEARLEVVRLRAALAVYADYANWPLTYERDADGYQAEMWNVQGHGWDVAEAALGKEVET